MTKAGSNRSRLQGSPQLRRHRGWWSSIAGVLFGWSAFACAGEAECDERAVPYDAARSQLELDTELARYLEVETLWEWQPAPDWYSHGESGTQPVTLRLEMEAEEAYEARDAAQGCASYVTVPLRLDAAAEASTWPGEGSLVLAGAQSATLTALLDPASLAGARATRGLSVELVVELGASGHRGEVRARLVEEGEKTLSVKRRVLAELSSPR